MEPPSLSQIQKILEKTLAKLIIARHKKHSDLALYNVLKNCLKIAEICRRNQKELDHLNNLLQTRSLLPGKTRQYIEHSSDIYQRVCLYVFHGEEHSANINRYAIALREAVKQKVTAETLISELLVGGINRFFCCRAGTKRTKIVSLLRLNEQIEHEKGAKLTLVLKELNGVYKIISFT